MSIYKGGYAGNLLSVNLSDSRIEKLPLSDSLVKNYIGGRGINVKLLYDETKPGIDPLGPENVLIFGTGPFVGTIVPSSGRWNATTKSATTRVFGDSNSGGHWGPELKFAGYDHLVIKGASEKPVYIWIDDDKVEIKDAGDIWGADTWETTEIIQEKLGDKGIQVLAIGLAGENMVSYACPINNLTRAPGRGGTGAVMGSKKLKAVAVRGGKDITVAQSDKVLGTVKKLFDRIASHPGAKLRSIEGTPMLCMIANEAGGLGWKNMQIQKFDEMAAALSGKRFVENWSIKSKGCFNCPVHCSHYYGVKEGPYKNTFAEGVEWDASYEFGLKAGIDYWPAVLKANELANRYGMDVDGLGGTISWAMECVEKGILDSKDLDGVDLRFGNHEAMISIIHKIAKREGIGDLLARNIRDISSEVGKGSEQFAHEIKGLTVIAELRIGYGWALGHAVANIGCHHLRGAVLSDHDVNRSFSEDFAVKMFGDKRARIPTDPTGKGKVVQWVEHNTVLNDCVEICKFICSPYAGIGLVSMEDILELMGIITGVAVTEEDVKNISERILALERAFNAREGMSRKEDTLPPRMWEPVPTGPHKGFQFDKAHWESVLDDYYHAHGWDQNGVPTRKTLEGLGLNYVADELEKVRKHKIELNKG